MSGSSRAETVAAQAELGGRSEGGGVDEGREVEAVSGPAGDWGRDVALWLGRTVYGLKLRELAERAALERYGSVSTALRYLQTRADGDARLSKSMSQAKGRLSSGE
jgi:hypothetical protein